MRRVGTSSAAGRLAALIFVAATVLPADAAGQSPETPEQPRPADEDAEAEPEGDSSPDSAAPRIHETVVVTASRAEAPLLTAPAAISVRTREDLASEASRTFADLFEGIPGISIQGNARRITEAPNIRGFSDQQVVVRQDGGRQNFNAAHGGRFFIDPDLVERIEVLRGANSAAFGSGALGGVVSLTTRSARDLVQAGKNFGGRYRVGYQSNGRDLTQSLSAFAAGERLDGIASVTMGGTGRPVRDGDGAEIPNTEDTIRNGLVKLGWTPSAQSRWEVSWQRFDNSAAEPTNANALTGSLVDRDTRWDGLRARFTHRPLGSELFDIEVLGYRNAVGVAEEMRVTPRRDETAFETLGIEATNTSRFRWSDAVRFTLTTGVETYRDRQSGTRDGAARLQFPDADASYQAAFANGEVDVHDRILVTLGLRRDAWTLASDRFPRRAEAATSPRATVGVLPFEGAFVWVGAARGFRVPSLTELYADGLHFQFMAGQGVQVLNWFRPDPMLGAERGRSLEAGFRGGRGALALETACFQHTVAGYVDQLVVLSDPRYPIGTDPVTGEAIIEGSTLNVPVDARLRGCEASLGWERPRFRLRATGSLLDTENLESGATLARAPANALHLMAAARAPRLDLEFGGRASLAGARTDTPDLVEDSSGYRVLDLFVRFSPDEGPLAGVDWTIAVNNLTDEYFAVFPAVVPQPGRSLRVSLAYRYGAAR